MIKKGLYFEQTFCQKVFSDITHSIYPGIHLFIVLTECLPKAGTFMRIILSDPAKNGLEGGAWIDGYDYQNKVKNFFFRAVYHSTTRVITHPVIAAIFDTILNI